MHQVLVVDDSRDLLEFFPFFLEKYELGCLTAHNEKEMYSHLQTTLPKIILLDVILLNEDGREICRTLKQDSRYCQVPVILMSAGPAILRNYQTVKADAIIDKPFNIHELVEKINNLTGHLIDENKIKPS